MTWLRNLWDRLFGPVEREFTIHDASVVVFPDGGVKSVAAHYILPDDPNRRVKSVAVVPHIWAEYYGDAVVSGRYFDRHAMFAFAPPDEAGFHGSYVCHAWTGMACGGVLTVRTSDQYDVDSMVQAAMDVVVIYSKRARLGAYLNGDMSEQEWLEEIAYWGDVVDGKRKSRKSR